MEIKKFWWLVLCRGEWNPPRGGSLSGIWAGSAFDKSFEIKMERRGIYCTDRDIIWLNYDTVRGKLGMGEMDIKFIYLP